jgi:hypothetical protein
MPLQLDHVCMGSFCWLSRLFSWVRSPGTTAGTCSLVELNRIQAHLSKAASALRLQAANLGDQRVQLVASSTRHLKVCAGRQYMYGLSCTCCCRVSRPTA